MRDAPEQSPCSSVRTCGERTRNLPPPNRSKALNSVPTSPLITWLQRLKWRGALLSLVSSLLCLVAGGGLVALIFIGFYAASLLFAPALMARSPLPLLPAGLTVAFCGVLFVDMLRSRRDDLSIPALWLIRELVGLGPRLLLESARCLSRARSFGQFDPALVAQVLFWLCNRRKSAAWTELLQEFPAIENIRFRDHLRLIDGVLFLNADFSRVTLSQPLRLWIARLTFQTAPKAELPPAQPPEESEPLAPHEILGVQQNATLAEIKSAYRQQIKQCHPDHFLHRDPGAREEAEEWTKILNAAYATLCAERGRGRNRP